jgi:hypothetical protein
MKRIFQVLWRSDRFALRIVRVVGLLLIGVVILIMAFEDHLIYFPTKYPDGLWNVQETCTRKEEVFPKIEDCYFTTSDGVKLHGWHCSPLRCKSGVPIEVPADMVFLWFHGNAGNISYRYDMIRALMTLPVQVFIVDYRGYGKSEGKPTERGLNLDARAAWDYLVNERRVAPERVIIFGKSLGGAPAVDLATHVEPAGLIIQSSFTSASDMAASVLPVFPRFLLRTKMDSLGKISGVSCPKLFIHSRADEVVPFELGWRLYQAAPEPKQFHEVIAAPHNSTYLVGGKPYLDALGVFVDSCKPR